MDSSCFVDIMSDSSNFSDFDTSSSDPDTLNPENFFLEMSSNSIIKIPKIIMRIFNDQPITNDDIHTHMGNNEWKIVNMTMPDLRPFIKKYYPTIQQYYDSLVDVQDKCSLFIAIWMYIKGGIYINSIYRLKSSFTSLIENLPIADIYLSLDDQNQISTDLIVTKPKSNFWLDVINEMMHNHYPISTILTDVSNRGYNIRFIPKRNNNLESVLDEINPQSHYSYAVWIIILIVIIILIYIWLFT